MRALADGVVGALRRATRGHAGPLGRHIPTLGGREWEYVRECLETGWVSSDGRNVDRPEAMLAEYTCGRRAILVMNGTAALHLALLFAAVPRDDEVLVSALTFVGTANAVSYCGAVPQFVDSGESTLGLDPSKLRAHLGEVAVVVGGRCVNRAIGRTIPAVLPVHTAHLVAADVRT